jgi:hypothetical protein
MSRVIRQHMISVEKTITPADYNDYWLKTQVLYDERVEEIRNLCPEVESAVDLGGGSGGLSQETKALIIDWSEEGCRIARENGNEAICMNILDFLNETTNKYELVILADVLEEMKESETQELLDGIKKICSKYFVISTPTAENYINISTHQVIYTRDELLEMITARGFEMDCDNYHHDRLIARFKI